MEYVTEAIKQAEADLIDTRQELAMARELVKTLTADAKKIELELVGLRSYAQRRGLAEVEPAIALPVIGLPADGGADVVAISPTISLVPTDEGADLVLLSRSEAVATVMAQAPGPVDRTTIHEQCALAGRDDTLDDISLSLSGLKRAGRVEKLGKGLWRLVDDTSATGS